MANVATSTPTTAVQYPTTPMSIAALVVGWLIPGAGHLIQKKFIRGMLLMAAIFTMFFVGLGMQGKVYAFNTGDLLDILGFFGDIGAGGLYMATTAELETGMPIMMTMTLGAEKVSLKGVVVYSDPGHGVGVRFKDLDAANEKVLRDELAIA